ncbi:hypothetical protein GCM10009111_03770 [Colwellia asteriadis]|uniref:Uncharacterized protein n=1 Tax=Colwellia asteriadis TaxID=517723 RepID=A0ABN1L2Z6_9GAMM
MGSGAKKGDNRFGAHQLKKQQLRLDLIKRVLGDITRRKQVYPNEWQLAAHVSEEVNRILKLEYPKIAEKERSLVHPTTLVRKGTKYKIELEKHLLKSEKLSSINEMRAEILTYQLEISELKDELAAFKNFAKKNLGQVEGKMLTTSSANSVNKQDDARALDAAHKIVMALVEASDNVFSFNDGKIINCSRTVNNVIADENMLETTRLLDSYLFKGFEKDD